MKASQYDISIALNAWISQQKVSNWLAVTFLCPRLGKQRDWSKAIKQTMREFNSHFYRGKCQKVGLNNGALEMCRFLVLGGDHQTKKPFHVHGLIDTLGVDVDYFANELNRIWKRNVKRHLRKQKRPQYLANDAFAWHKRHYGSAHKYVSYMLRHEGSDFGKGTNKVLWDSTYLVGSRPAINIQNLHAVDRNLTDELIERQIVSDFIGTK